MEEKIVRDGLFKVHEDGTIFKKKDGNWEICNTYKWENNSNTYYIASAYLNGKQIHAHVHRLIGEAFVPNPDNKTQVFHKDGNSLNNDPSNLMWVTPKERAQLSVALGNGPQLSNTGVPCTQCGELTRANDGVCTKCKQQNKSYLNNIKRLESVQEEYKNIDTDFLNHREKIIVEMRMQGKTLQEISDCMGVVRERIRQILEKVKQKNQEHQEAKDILSNKTISIQDIKTIRKKLGIKQRQMCLELSTGPATYKKKENNPTTFSVEQIRKISAIFNKEIDIYEGD